jgi:hypothetical protein
VPIDGARWGIWPMGAAWLSLHLAEHYDYTLDQVSWPPRVPGDEGSRAILSRYLVPDGPSHRRKTSTTSSGEQAVTMGPTMDTEVLHANLANSLKPGGLGIDAAFRATVRSHATNCSRCKSGSLGRSRSGLKTTKKWAGTAISRIYSRCFRHRSHRARLGTGAGRAHNPRACLPMAEATRLESCLDHRLLGSAGRRRASPRKPARAAERVDPAKPVRQPSSVSD